MAILVELAVYFLPTLIALARSHKQLKTIFFVNLLTGWTIVGWCIAGVWAVL